MNIEKIKFKIGDKICFTDNGGLFEILEINTFDPGLAFKLKVLKGYKFNNALGSAKKGDIVFSNRDQSMKSKAYYTVRNL